jgi:hypothetical protein
MLRGTVPTETSNLNSLVELELEDNDLSGTMPNQVCSNRLPLGLLEKLEADCDGWIVPQIVALAAVLSAVLTVIRLRHIQPI